MRGKNIQYSKELKKGNKQRLRYREEQNNIQDAGYL